MALADIDRDLLERCLAEKPRAWEDFIDRFAGLVIHVINHSANSRSIRLPPADREDLLSEVFLAVLDNDYAVLRRFRGRSSLATYLAVVARRVVVRRLLMSLSGSHEAYDNSVADPSPAPEQRIADADEVRQLLTRLDGAEAEIVRLFHLEGKNYREISNATGLAENSIGPALSRARAKLRQAAPSPASPMAPNLPHAADQPAG